MKQLENVGVIGQDDKQLLRELKDIVLRCVPDADLLLYGSAARGSRSPESDYDVLVLLNKPMTTGDEDTVRAAVYELELARGVVISTFFVTRDKWNLPLNGVTPFHRNVESEGVLL